MTKKLKDTLVGLDMHRAQLMLDLLTGTRALVAGFAVRRAGTVWDVQGLHPGAMLHSVLLDSSACSCPDNKFRGHTCKHMLAIRGALV